jgi:tRNA nucleotidyltransferase/poly(A) polymerase
MLAYPLHLRIPEPLNAVISLLQARGGQALLTGGYVRDALLGRETWDVDVATDLPHTMLEALVPSAWITVKLPQYLCIKCRLDPFDVDITTFRKEGGYVDHRHPTEVSPGTREEDARRRDLTINALYYDPIQRQILDDVGGLDDLLARGQVRLIRGVQSLEEDYLRIVRVIRFALQCGFAIEEKTLEALRSVIHHVREVDRDRLKQELGKCLTYGSLTEVLTLFEQTGLLTVFQAGLTHNPSMTHKVMESAANISAGEGTLMDLILMTELLTYQDPHDWTQSLKAKSDWLRLSKKHGRQIAKTFWLLKGQHVSNYHPSPFMKQFVKSNQVSRS